MRVDVAFDLCLHSGRSVETQRVDEPVGFVIFFLPQRHTVIGDSKIAGDEALLPGTIPRYGDRGPKRPRNVRLGDRASAVGDGTRHRRSGLQ